MLTSYLMWKDHYNLVEAIDKIKDKRKCIDINIGFILQLGKWEELLKFGKEFKLYKFENEGNLALLDIKDINNRYFTSGFTALIIVKDNKLYKVINKEREDLYKDKIDKFITILQTYDSYPSNVNKIYFDAFSNSKSPFSIEDLLNKISCNVL
jgi:hypothetical protein